MRFNKCIYGGGTACTKQGGSGSHVHKSAYVHQIPSSIELFQDGLPETTTPLDNGITKSDDDLSYWFDDQVALKSLSQDVPGAVVSRSISKSLYDFDINTLEGIQKIVYLLPILDVEVVKLISQELWPGYPVDTEGFDYKRVRMEIKGFLLDFLNDTNQKPETVPTITEVPEVPEVPVTEEGTAPKPNPEPTGTGGA